MYDTVGRNAPRGLPRDAPTWIEADRNAGNLEGGTETYLAAAADPRIAVAARDRCAGLRALEHDAWQSRAETFRGGGRRCARRRLGAGGCRTVATFYARVAPGIFGGFDAPAMLPLIAPRALLIITMTLIRARRLPVCRSAWQPWVVLRGVGGWIDSTLPPTRHKPCSRPPPSWSRSSSCSGSS
jgi:hypothetical protein